ncbi:Lysophospholipid acyltransferase [Tilletia horrida]|uniref:Lysophospholipid acyltransferase n=1 Tax=Tilletia horrida TaxID=155126 RepID=A0AAN6GGC8_9BASI|nr:Lysophospholipid acyltransferase [Tilletia horrida]KAK0539139.1 Lysophospholipid acyltransferase [Tilletia horrida]KAK0540230.1 Lysophospholipid acyltransferase [Tilletia horrida]
MAAAGRPPPPSPPLLQPPSHPARLLFASAASSPLASPSPSLFSAFSAHRQIFASPARLGAMLDAAFDRLSAASGTPPDYVRLFTLFLAAYPLALPLSSLDPTQKHLYSLAVTTTFLGPIMRLWPGYGQLVATSLATYYVAKYKVGGRRMPWLVMFFQMGHLICNHLVRELTGIPLTTVEITAMQMVLCMNLTTFAWDVYDGQQRSEAECDSQQRESRIVHFPSLLEFAGYVSYFPGVLIGPSTRFNDYIAWARGDLYARARAADPAAEQAAQERGVKKIKRTPPPAGRFPAAAKELLIGVTATALFSIFGAAYTYEKLILPGSKGGWADKSLFVKIGLMQLAGLAARLKYYGIWSLTNGACVLSGLAYNGVRPNGKERWDRCKNIDIVHIEFANNWKELLDHWNQNTNIWLRNNVYKRVAKPGKKPGFKSTMLTFLTSAFWHGISPGYYLTFVLGGLNQSVARTLRRHVRPLFFSDPRAPNPSVRAALVPKSKRSSAVPARPERYSAGQWLYSVLSIAAVQLTLNFTVTPFMLLSVSDSLKAWHGVGYYGAVMTVGTMLAFRVGGLGAVLDKQSGVTAKRKAEKAKAAAEQSGTGGAEGSKKDLRVLDGEVVEQAGEKVFTEGAQVIKEQLEETKKDI